MPATIVEIGEALKVELAAHTFSQPFDPERSFVATWKLEEVTDLQVIVAFAELEEVPETRATVTGDYIVHLVVMKRIEATDVEACDAMLAFVQEVADHFWKTKKRRLDAVEGARLARYQTAPLYDEAALRDKNVFRSLLRLTYKAER